ncbi:MAG: hypothetical protein JO019_03405 [Candidatus Kaiserbacteria bacterium]|nr:hypothetical protein [Candidatus Kaiserbacteria bacterium]
MQTFKKVGAVVAGFVVATVIMLIFEWINHWLFPKPASLDVMNAAAVQAFTASLPWTAYILVFLGWAVGAFEGACTTSWLAREKVFRSSAVLAAILMLAGIFDMWMLGFPPVFTLIGLVFLAVFPYLGHRTLLWYEAKKRAQMAA